MSRLVLNRLEGSELTNKSDIDQIIQNSDKRELLDQLSELLKTMDKAVVVLVQDKDGGGGYTSLVFTLGLTSNYEAYGLLEIAKQDIMESENE